ncbi:uncharacterized [Tachysurus ichikawai]
MRSKGSGAQSVKRSSSCSLSSRVLSRSSINYTTSLFTLLSACRLTLKISVKTFVSIGDTTRRGHCKPKPTLEVSGWYGTGKVGVEISEEQH